MLNELIHRLIMYIKSVSHVTKLERWVSYTVYVKEVGKLIKLPRKYLK